MRLSDAIALGRVMIPHRRGCEAYGDGSGCARGMALEAVGKRVLRAEMETPADSHSNYQDFVREWPWTINTVVEHPITVSKQRPAFIVSYIFDLLVMGDKSWTLDQLIDWVRSVEPNEPTPEETDPEFVEASAEVLEWAT